VTNGTALDLIILSACAAGACTDVAFRRIPNSLTIATAALAAGMHAADGLASLALCLLTMSVVATAGFFLFNYRLIGGGDVKLIAAAAGGFGFPAFLPFLLYTMLAGGMLALIVAAIRGTFKQSCYSAFSATYPLVYRTGFYLPPATGKMPYGLAIFAGAALALLSATIIPLLRIPL